MDSSPNTTRTSGHLYPGAGGWSVDGKSLRGDNKGGGIPPEGRPGWADREGGG